MALILRFLQQYDKYFPTHFGEKELAMLKAISTKLGNGKRAVDLEVIRSFAEGDIAIGKEGLCARGIKEEALRSASRVLTGEYLSIARREHRPFRCLRSGAHAVREPPVSRLDIAISSLRAASGR